MYGIYFVITGCGYSAAELRKDKRDRNDIGGRCGGACSCAGDICPDRSAPVSEVTARRLCSEIRGYGRRVKGDTGIDESHR